MLLHHADPFHRLLIAQSFIQQRQLLKTDEKILSHFKNIKSPLLDNLLVTKHSISRTINVI